MKKLIIILPLAFFWLISIQKTKGQVHDYFYLKNESSNKKKLRLTTRNTLLFDSIKTTSSATDEWRFEKRTFSKYVIIRNRAHSYKVYLHPENGKLKHNTNGKSHHHKNHWLVEPIGDTDNFRLKNRETGGYIYTFEDSVLCSKTETLSPNSIWKQEFSTPKLISDETMHWITSSYGYSYNKFHAIEFGAQYQFMTFNNNPSNSIGLYTGAEYLFKPQIVAIKMTALYYWNASYVSRVCAFCYFYNNKTYVYPTAELGITILGTIELSYGRLFLAKNNPFEISPNRFTFKINYLPNWSKEAAKTKFSRALKF